MTPRAVAGLLCMFLVGCTGGQASADQTTPPTTVQAATTTIDVGIGRLNRSAVYNLAQGEESAAAPEVRTVSAAGRGQAPPPVFRAPWIAWRTLPDGSRCFRIQQRAFTNQSDAEAFSGIYQIVAPIVVPRDQPCPASDVPEPAPASAAASFWRTLGEDQFPQPAPRIAPGYMLAGKLAYLEAGTQATAHFEHPTPLGTLVIEATGRLYVDWGDRTGLDGPHDGPGGPWPEGTITHFWTTAGRYDIRVVQRWTARWALGASSGTLDGIETQATIDAFEVRQLQAVRTS